MSLAKQYTPATAEPRLQATWQEAGTYHFNPEGDGPIFSVDTPPPTVSGRLHLGHVYSYSHADFLVRFQRMQGQTIFYPMGYDDNGLPTERLVERQLGITAPEVGRRTFIEKCLEVSEEAEKEYQALWQRLGLSVDWRYTYRTIDADSRRTSQHSFLDLLAKGLAYRQSAPAIWCPECRTAIAQAELHDLERSSEFVTLAFTLPDGSTLPIATTRPELLPACVAIFVHPEDARFAPLVGQQVTVPLFGQQVPLMTDPGADPEKGTGAVMCCTFGDTADVTWWYTHRLPLIAAIDRGGRLTEVAGAFSDLLVPEARKAIVAALDTAGLLLGRESISQSVRVHERCDTPVEYLVVPQWFIRVLDFKEAFLAAGEAVTWYPAHMQTNYRHWVENLNWDWCISRQRYFGIPFPVWYCRACGETVAARPEQLPLDPTETGPEAPCPACGGTDFRPEEDVMDTWATSSLSPQIVGRWLNDPELYARLMPFSMRPQAHEIIRTWAFYTIVKSHHHFGTLPWKTVAISGWGLAPEGTGKISKSRGGGPAAPMAMIQQYSADALRYWAASTGFGKDSVINEEKIQAGGKLVTKLWNVARFSERFLGDGLGASNAAPIRSAADRWILARLARLVTRTTDLFGSYDYATAKSEIETFFWRDLADNYLEMAKKRLYEATGAEAAGVRATLRAVLLTTIKLFAPFLPYVTEEIFLGLFPEEGASIHTSRWPVAEADWFDPAAERTGEALIEIATAVRRYKSEQALPLGSELPRLQIAVDGTLAPALAEAAPDLASITRAQAIEVVATLDPMLTTVIEGDGMGVAIAPPQPASLLAPGPSTPRLTTQSMPQPRGAGARRAGRHGV